MIDFGKSGLADNEAPIVWQEGLWIPLGTLKDWAEGHGVRFWQGNLFRIPQLAPGSYTVCLGAPGAVLSNEIEAWKGQAKCATGYLAAGSSLDLRLP